MKRKIVLASKSPRRKFLLELMGLKFEIRESQYEEDMQAYQDPYRLVKFLAFKKAEEVARHYPNAIIIGADTFVVYKNKFIGKPKDKKDALRIIKLLSGKSHLAISGLALIDTKTGKKIITHEEAKVTFRKLSDNEIKKYLRDKECLSMAGAYGLMGKAAGLIKSIEGDFYSIIGLPLTKLHLSLKKMGVDCLDL
jgi:septum formation protein